MEFRTISYVVLAIEIASRRTGDEYRFGFFVPLKEEKEKWKILIPELIENQYRNHKAYQHSNSTMPWLWNYTHMYVHTYVSTSFQFC